MNKKQIDNLLNDNAYIDNLLNDNAYVDEITNVFPEIARKFW